jgi:hypothetical protein
MAGKMLQTDDEVLEANSDATVFRLSGVGQAMDQAVNADVPHIKERVVFERGRLAATVDKVTPAQLLSKKGAYGPRHQPKP